MQKKFIIQKTKTMIHNHIVIRILKQKVILEEKLIVLKLAFHILKLIKKYKNEQNISNI
jgi:hypothetical protein